MHIWRQETSLKRATLIQTRALEKLREAHYKANIKQRLFMIYDIKSGMEAFKQDF